MGVYCQSYVGLGSPFRLNGIKKSISNKTLQTQTTTVVPVVPLWDDSGDDLESACAGRTGACYMSRVPGRHHLLQMGTWVCGLWGRNLKVLWAVLLHCLSTEGESLGVCDLEVKSHHFNHIKAIDNEKRMSRCHSLNLLAIEILVYTIRRLFLFVHSPQELSLPRSLWTPCL